MLQIGVFSFLVKSSRLIITSSNNTKNLHQIRREIRMALNQRNLQVQVLKQMVTNLLTKMLRVLENCENMTPDTNEFLDSMAEVREAQRAINGQAIQMEENGIETRALVLLLFKLAQFAEAVFGTARDQWDHQSVDLVFYLLEKILNDPFGPGVVGFDGVPRMMELHEEIKIYYGRILDHESLRELHEVANGQLQLLENWPFTRVEIYRRFMAEVGEMLKAMLRKFLDVETLLNDQHN